VSPVKSVSSLRCGPNGAPPLGGCLGAAASVTASPLEFDELEPEPLAALAIP